MTLQMVSIGFSLLTNPSLYNLKRFTDFSEAKMDALAGSTTDSFRMALSSKLAESYGVSFAVSTTYELLLTAELEVTSLPPL